MMGTASRNGIVLSNKVSRFFVPLMLMRQKAHDKKDDCALTCVPCVLFFSLFSSPLGELMPPRAMEYALERICPLVHANSETLYDVLCFSFLTMKEKNNT